MSSLRLRFPVENVNGTAWYVVVQQDLGCKSVLCDWGVQVNLEVLSDSGAARGLTCRQGLGSKRHIQTIFLWVQERVRKGHPRILRARRTISQISLRRQPMECQARSFSRNWVSSTLQRRQNTRRSRGAERGVRNGFWARSTAY